MKGHFFLVKLAQNWAILEQNWPILEENSTYSWKIAKIFAKNLEKVHCKSMILHGNSLHRKGPIFEAKFWAEPMVVNL